MAPFLEATVSKATVLSLSRSWPRTTAPDPSRWSGAWVGY